MISLSKKLDREIYIYIRFEQALMALKYYFQVKIRHHRLKSIYKSAEISLSTRTDHVK